MLPGVSICHVWEKVNMLSLHVIKLHIIILMVLTALPFHGKLQQACSYKGQRSRSV